MGKPFVSPFIGEQEDELSEEKEEKEGAEESEDDWDLKKDEEW